MEVMPDYTQAIPDTDMVTVPTRYGAGAWNRGYGGYAGLHTGYTGHGYGYGAYPYGAGAGYGAYPYGAGAWNYGLPRLPLPAAPTAAVEAAPAAVE